MALLSIRPLDPAQARTAQVTVTLCDAAGRKVVGYTASGEMVQTWTGRTDSVGVLDVDLVPNAEVQPAPTGYLVQIGSSRHLIVKAAHPQTLYEALATDLGPLSPVVGAQGPQGEPGLNYLTDVLMAGTDGHIYAVAPAGALTVGGDVIHALVPSDQLSVNSDDVLVASLP